MLSPRLYVAQRLSAVLMAPLVLGHLAVMIYAIQGGLDSAEILSRTQGSLFWFTFYQLFVIAVSIHAALGAGLANGTLNPVIGREFPLVQAAEAHGAVMEAGAFGKIVLVPAGT